MENSPETEVLSAIKQSMALRDRVVEDKVFLVF